MKLLLSVIAIVVEDDSTILRYVVSLKFTDVSEILKMSHSPDNEGRNRLWNVGQLQRDYMATAQHPKKLQIISSSSSLYIV
jgi:hypothetical protein